MRHERQVELLRQLKDRDSDDLLAAGGAQHAQSGIVLCRSGAVRGRAAGAVSRPSVDDRPQLGECAAVGSTPTADLGGVPVAVVRQADGSLRGFVNVCRHRGAPVIAHDGPPRPRLSCPYHGWVYDLDGALVARPHGEEGFDDAPKADCGLHPVAVAEGYGLIFAQAEGGEGLTAERAAGYGRGRDRRLWAGGLRPGRGAGNRLGFQLETAARHLRRVLPHPHPAQEFDRAGLSVGRLDLRGFRATSADGRPAQDRARRSEKAARGGLALPAPRHHPVHLHAPRA